MLLLICIHVTKPNSLINNNIYSTKICAVAERRNEVMMNTFTKKNSEKLDKFTSMSKIAGSRSDYVQGGGGNTSCKLDEQLMVIKASGFRLDQITPDHAYAVLDYAVLRDFYGKTDPAKLDDIEKIGSEQTKTATMTIDGLPELRPSVEAGFHSILDTFVLHTHAVYANLLACAAEGQKIIDEIMTSLGEPYAIVPYINPGAQLTFAIATAREAAAQNTGKKPSVIFMENHGLVVTGETAEYCLDLHDRVNLAIAAYFDFPISNWPSFKLKSVKQGENTYYLSQTDTLRNRLLQGGWDANYFMADALYPDQLVFLNGQISVNQTDSAESFLQKKINPESKVMLFSRTGEILYHTAENEAQTIEETLYCVLFIKDTIQNKKFTVQTMNETGKSFIQNWESEKYRKSVAERNIE